MKKLFTLVAMAIMAVGANAQDSYNFADVTAADFTNLVGFTASIYDEKPSLTYDGGSVVGSFYVYDVIKFSYKNSGEKKDFIKLSDIGVYTNGKGASFEITTATPNSTVKIGLAAKGSTAPNFTLNNGTGTMPTCSTTKVDGNFPVSIAEVVSDGNGKISITDGGGGFTISTLEGNFSKSTTGISGVAADKAAENAPIYNLAGQRVSKDAKGVLIQNGKKFVNK